MSTRCPNAEKVRQVLRRLERRPRPAPSQGLQQESRRRPLASQDANPGPRKKIPGLGTLGQLAEAWAEGRSSATHEHQVAQELRTHIGQLRPHQVSELAIAGLILTWKKKWSSSTVYVRASVLRKFLRSVERLTGAQGLAAAVPTIKDPGPRRTIANPDELQRLADHAPHWLRCWLLLSIELGCRINEACTICAAGWNPDKHTVSFQTKGHRIHTLPLTPEAEALFQTAPASDDPLEPLLARIRGQRTTTRNLRHHWRMLKARAAVNPDLRPHDLRRTSAVALYELAKDIRTVSHFLGHQHIGSTLDYLAHYDPQTLRPLLKQLWTPRGEKEPIQ